MGTNVSRGITLTPSAYDESSAVAILDNFNAANASSATWRLHTTANVTLNPGNFSAELTINSKQIRVTFNVQSCPSARFRVVPGTQWVPSARRWPGHTALLLQTNDTRNCFGFEVFFVPGHVTNFTFPQMNKLE